jgi:hypothetical protein
MWSYQYGKGFHVSNGLSRLVRCNAARTGSGSTLRGEHVRSRTMGLSKRSERADWYYHFTRRYFYNTLLRQSKKKIKKEKHHRKPQ